MSILTEISFWLKDNDVLIKVVATVAAPGGIWLWIDKVRNRIRVKVRSFGFPLGGTSICGLTFEAENVSSTLTSFEPQFTLIGYTPMRRKRTYTFTFSSPDRQLPSHVSKHLVCYHNNAQDDMLAFLWFMTLTFPLSRGRSVKVRFRNIEFETVGFWQFHWERLLYLCSRSG